MVKILFSVIFFDFVIIAIQIKFRKFLYELKRLIESEKREEDVMKKKELSNPNSNDYLNTVMKNKIFFIPMAYKK